MTPDQTPITVFDPSSPPPPPGAPLVIKPEASRIIQADSSGRVKEENFTLQPFPDGSLFRYGPSGKPDGSCVMMDANGQPVALVKNEFLADFLCRGAFLFFSHLKQMETHPTTNENISSAPDTKPPVDNSAPTS